MKNACQILSMLILLVVVSCTTGGYAATNVVVESMHLEVLPSGGIEIGITVMGRYPNIDFGINPGNPSLDEGYATLTLHYCDGFQEASLTVNYTSSASEQELRARADSVVNMFKYSFLGLSFTAERDYSVGGTKVFIYSCSGQLDKIRERFTTCKPDESVKALITSGFLSKCREYVFKLTIGNRDNPIAKLEFKCSICRYFSCSGTHVLDFKELFGIGGHIPHIMGRSTITIDLPVGSYITDINCGEAEYNAEGTRLTVTLGSHDVENIIVAFIYNFPIDVTAPTISILTPPEGGKVKGSVTISVEVYDDGGIAWVAFLVDGNVIANLTAPPWQFIWDSSTVPDGEHTIEVKACDLSGNAATKSVTIHVSNHEEELTILSVVGSFYAIALIIAIVLVVVLILVLRSSGKTQTTILPGG